MAEAGEAPGEVDPATFPGAAALVSGASGWFLADESPARSLGRALAWADQQGVDELNVLAAQDSGVLARRATEFSNPPRIWHVSGRSIERARPDEPEEPRSPPPAALDLISMLAEAEVEIVIEHGVVRGEVLGLEVARIVAGDDDGQARIEVGVGRHDREAFAMIHGDVPTPQALASVVDSVRIHRRAGASPHPLGRLAAERWLRVTVEAHPELVGAVSLESTEPALPRDNVKEPAPAVAVGIDESGTRVVVACSTGVDLDLVPSGADARLMHASDARLVLVVPTRDAHPVTRRLADALTRPAEIVTVEEGWRA